MSAGAGHPTLRDARPVPYWLDRSDAPEPTERLRGRSRAELVVVGAGFTGLWTALLAKQRDPSLDVVVLEGRTTAHAASGRNGGFCAASLTHGLANGNDRFPAEIADLEKLGLENLDAIEATVREHVIDCDWRRSGELTVAVEPWQVDGLRARVELARQVGSEHRWLDGDRVRELVDSPTYLGGVLDAHGCAMVDPARLAWGLRRVCLETGVRLYENSPVSGLTPEADAVRVTTHEGQVRTRRVALATNAYPPLLHRLRHYVVPVWDYALMTEPLGAEQWASIGWDGHEGLSDAGNQFHYYRRAGDRILWGGWDAIYGFGNEVSPSWGQRQKTFAVLAEHFAHTFPALGDVRFSHQWGGLIDACSRFCAFYGSAMSGRLAYAVGYTGLGVGASRFGARVVLAHLGLPVGDDARLLELEMVRTKPLPFPPEPVRWAGIQLTRRAIARADAGGGRRGPWLRTLDRLGLGFDS